MDKDIIKYIINYLNSKGLIYNNKPIFSMQELEKIAELSNNFAEFEKVNFYDVFDFKKIIILKKIQWLDNYLYKNNKLIYFNYNNKLLLFNKYLISFIINAINEYNILNNSLDKSLGKIKFKDDCLYIDEHFSYDNFLEICSGEIEKDFSFEDFMSYEKIYSKNILTYKYSESLKNIVYNKIVKITNAFATIIKPINGNFAFMYEGKDAYEHSTILSRDKYEKVQGSYKYFDIKEGKYYSIPKKNFKPIKTYQTQVLDVFIKPKNDNNISYLLSESFVKLGYNYYDLYGFFLKSDITNAPYFLIIDAKKTLQNSINKDSILNMNGKTNFDKYINFIYYYVNKVGNKYNISLLKHLGQAYVLNFALTHIVNAIKNIRCHSILLGGQDKGKSYISTIMSSIYYPFVEIVESDFSRAGLVAAANQQIVTPNEIFKNQLLVGSFAKPSVILEEFFDIYDDKNTDHIDILSTMKTGLIKSTVKLGKLGAVGEIPFNASVIITGNYKPAKIEEDINEAKKLVYMRKKDLNNTYGEMNENLLDKQLSGVSNSEIEDLFAKYDLFDLTVNNEIISYARDFLIKKYAKKNLDYRTEFPNAVIKRFLFNVIGTLNEVELTNDNINYSENKVKRSIENYEKFILHIPNLKQILKEIGSKFSEKDLDTEYKNKYLNELKFIYANYVKIIGEKSFINILNDVYDSVLLFNNEKVPSNESKEIIERWLYIQNASLNNDLINNFTKNRKKYNIFWSFEK